MQPNLSNLSFSPLQTNLVLSLFFQPYLLLQNFVELDSVEKMHSDFTRNDKKEENPELWYSFSKCMELREIFKQEIQSICNEVATSVNLSELKVLEIGSGKIPNSSQSYLSNMLISRSWVFSDFFPASSKNLPKPYLKFDLIKGCTKSNDIFDCIIGCNVLDTLSYNKMTSVFHNISQLLEPNGLCIHFSDLPFWADSFFEAIAEENEDYTFLPTIDLSNSAYRIKNKNFQQILKEKEKFESQEEIDFFTYWGNQRNVLQAATLWKLASSEPLQTNLIDRINSIFSTNLELICSQELFTNSIDKAATANGFTVEMCKPIHIQMMRDLPEGGLPRGSGANYAIFNQGTPSSFFAPIAPGKLLTEATVHVLVARKN